MIRSSRAAKRAGITLAEVLVVSGIVGLFLAITLPAIQHVREASCKLACKANLHQIGLALHQFHDDYHRLPPLPRDRRRKADPNGLLSWMTQILPYLEKSDLYLTSVQACVTDADVTHNPPHVGLATVIPVYVCASDTRLSVPMTDAEGVTATFTSYIGIAGTKPANATRGLDGVLGYSPGRNLSSISDGLSNTLMVGERPPPDSLQAGWWYSGYYGSTRMLRGPNVAMILGNGPLFPSDPCTAVKTVFGPGRLDNPCDRFHLWSMHPRGANFLFADLSARFFPYSASPIMEALASRNNGEFIDLSSFE